MDNANLKDIYDKMRTFIEQKKPNQVDTPEIQTVKGLIRKGEAIAGARYFGLEDDHIHFVYLLSNCIDNYIKVAVKCQ